MFQKALDSERILILYAMVLLPLISSFSFVLRKQSGLIQVEAQIEVNYGTFMYH